MRRGEVWWAELPPPVGPRPVVLVSRDEAYAVRASVTVVPVTRRIRHIPVEVELGAAEGLRWDCVANADDLQTIPMSSLLEFAGALPLNKLRRLESAIKFALSLEE
ncbi:MAG: type II toxin-antitoxin system PemK/MazF family toxin [Chloroflexota bacterium]